MVTEHDIFCFLSRMFHSEKKEEPCQGFIDGDLVETFLDLDRSAVVFGVVIGHYVAVVCSVDYFLDFYRSVVVS